MSEFQLVKSGTKIAIRTLGSPIKSGGEGDIYRVAGINGFLAKIYHARNTSNRGNRNKLEAMIVNPPSQLSVVTSGTSLPLFSWPTNIIENDRGDIKGFLMPEIPTDRAVTLTKYTSRNLSEGFLSEDDRSLPRKFEICRNLSVAISELHRQGHYFVDLKPDNIFLFKDVGIVCLIDNDGFSINGQGKRFPAQTYTQQYLAPEILKNALSPDSIANDLQDRFALAAMMFQILNNGLHPFQGVCLIQSEEWNIDYCVRNGYYPYGLKSISQSRPSESSTHDCWSHSTRELFDRAFMSTQYENRPSAQEWKDHFDQFIRASNKFVRCKKIPSSVLHIHLIDGDCPECRFTSLIGDYQKPAVSVNEQPTAVPISQLPPPDPSNRKWLYVIVFIFFAICMLLFIAING